MALLQRFSFILLFASLIGCGGGDGGLSDGGGDDGETPTSPIVITLSISTNEPVSEQNPAVITATVKQDNQPLTNKLVTFTLDDEEIAFFNIENGAVSTSDEGVATITLLAGGKSGGGVVTANLGSGESSEPLGFNSLGDGNTGESPKVFELNLLANNQQMASSGADDVVLSAIVKDINNNLIEGATVGFSADSGDIQVEKAVTDSDGKASAVLRTNSDATNRLITVTATSDIISDTVQIQVVGTSINLTGSSSLAINDSTTFNLSVLDSDGKGIAGTTVNLSIDSGGSNAQLEIPDSVVTNATGRATFSVIGRTGGLNQIIASANGASAVKNISVKADSFLFTQFDNGNGSIIIPSEQPSSTEEVLLSDTASLTLTWLRSGTPVADGAVVNFTSTRGTLAANSATTVDGKVTVSIDSINAGKTLVTFTGVDGSVELTNQFEFEFVAETVETLVVQASPSSIGPNGDTTTISVIVRDINGNLVKNKAIDFSLSDTNGGTIFPASAVTDSNGAASTIYTSNTISAQDGISISATVRSQPTITDTVTLTVADRELFIALGTGNDLIEEDSTIYNKQYSVFVTDVDSTPVENVTLTLSVVPTHFYKGFWDKQFDENGEFETWFANYSIRCANEDANIDGILDPGEDINNNGRLTPGNDASVIGEVVTDSDGRALIDIRYPQSFGHWVDVNLIASTKVTGTESNTLANFTLPVLASDLLNEDVTPPTSNTGGRGPFGADGSCTNID